MYTHYFDNIAVDDLLAERARSIVDYAERDGISIRGGMGDGNPEITETHILLNGDASKGEDYESFHIGAGSMSIDRFCKTARQPYDAVVTAILIAYVVSHRAYSKVSSDGRFADWVNGGGVSLYEHAVKPLTSYQAHRLHQMLGDSPYSLVDYGKLDECSEVVKEEFPTREQCADGVYAVIVPE